MSFWERLQANQQRGYNRAPIVAAAKVASKRRKVTKLLRPRDVAAEVRETIKANEKMQAEEQCCASKPLSRGT